MRCSPRSGGTSRGRRERAGLSRKELAARLPGYKNVDSANANVWNWELGKNRIGVEDYEAARVALGAGYLTCGHDDLCREWAVLTATYEARRRPFQLARATGPVTGSMDVPPGGELPRQAPV